MIEWSVVSGQWPVSGGQGSPADLIYISYADIKLNFLQTILSFALAYNPRHFVPSFIMHYAFYIMYYPIY